MVDAPKLSVLLTTYNGQRYIKETIVSILNQTYTNFKFLIINDGSKDNTEHVIHSFNDDRIEYYRTEHNGHISALNYGLAKCDTEFVSVIDHDDIALNNKLELQINFLLNNKDIGVVGTSYLFMGHNGKRFGKITLPKTDKEIKAALLYRDVVCHTGVMYRTRLVVDEGGYIKDFGVAADYELWLRLYNKTKFYNIDKYLINFRKHNESLTTALSNYSSNNHSTLLALKKHSNLIDDKHMYIFGIWEVVYGSVSLGRQILLKKFLNSANSKVKIKYLIISLFPRRVIDFYFFYNPIRRFLNFIR